MRILVVEDEAKVARFVRKGLEAEGYEVETAADGIAGERKARSGMFDLLVLDILLPKKDGLSIVSSLRQDGIRLPILMLTARSDIADVVTGLDRGADDYLTKPFVFEEFLARIRSLLRRGRESKTLLRAGDLQLDTVTRKAIRNGKMIELTSREFALLEYLIRHQSQVVTRLQLAKEIWGYTFDPGTNVVDVYINHLRKKIDFGFSEKLLLTVRGKGYMLSVKNKPSATP